MESIPERLQRGFPSGKLGKWAGTGMGDAALGICSQTWLCWDPFILIHVLLSMDSRVTHPCIPKSRIFPGKWEFDDSRVVFCGCFFSSPDFFNFFLGIPWKIPSSPNWEEPAHPRFS